MKERRNGMSDSNLEESSISIVAETAENAVDMNLRCVRL